MKKAVLDLMNEKKMTLIMSLPSNDPALARVAWENGADVVKVHMNVEHRASKTHFGSWEEEQERMLQMLEEAKGPCGIVPGGDLASAVRDYKKAAEAGFSIVSLYSTNMATEILQYPDWVKMVALDQYFTTEEVISLGKIGGDILEASIMLPETYGQPLSVKELMQYDCICRHSSIPVVVPTQRKIAPEEVAALHQCGVDGIMVGSVVTGKDADSIARAVSAFRDQIERL